MTKRSELPQSRRHIMVFDEDWVFLETHFGLGTKANIGAGGVIKRIVHQKVQAIRQRMTEAIDANAGAVASEAMEGSK